MIRDRVFLKNVSWRMILDVLSRGSFFLVNILIARALGTSDFGKFAYAVSLTQIFYIFTDLGIGSLLAKELGESRDVDEGRWIDFFELKLVLMLLTTVFFCSISFFFWQWEKPWLLLLALVWMLANSLLDFNQFVCNGLGRLDVARDVMVLQRTATIVGVVISLVFFRTLSGLLIGIALGAVVGSIASNLKSHYALVGSFSWNGSYRKWRRIMKDALPLGVAAAFGLWYIRIGAVLLAWYCTSQVVGEYSAAFRVFEITYLFPAAIMSVSVPHLASSLKKGREFFIKDLKALSAAMIFAALVWTVLLRYGSSVIVHFLFGDRYANATPYLALLACAGGIVFLSYLVTNLMVILDIQKRHALNEALAFIIAFLLTVALVPSMGGFGAVYAVIGTELFRLAITSASLFKQWRYAALKAGVV